MMAWLGSRREIEGLLRREQEAAAISEAEGSVEFTVAIAKWTHVSHEPTEKSLGNAYC